MIAQRFDPSEWVSEWPAPTGAAAIVANADAMTLEPMTPAQEAMVTNANARIAQRMAVTANEWVDDLPDGSRGLELVANGALGIATGWIGG